MGIFCNLGGNLRPLVLFFKNYTASFYELFLYFCSLYNLDTPLKSLEIWKYLSQKRVLFETIHNSVCTLIVYVSQKTLPPSKDISIFHLWSVGYLLLHNSVFHNTCLRNFIIHCWKYGEWCMDLDTTLQQCCLNPYTTFQIVKKKNFYILAKKSWKYFFFKK